MPRYIDADATIRQLKRSYCTGCESLNGMQCRSCNIMDAIDIIDDQEVEDVVPAFHGRWLKHDGKALCSLCDRSNKQYKSPYCPHCGAKMDLEV